MILTKNEIQYKKEKYQNIFLSVTDTRKKYDDHHDKWSFYKVDQKKIFGRILNPGDIFLYEQFIDRGTIIQATYPKVGIYTDCYVVDQSIELEWFDRRRTWEYKTEYTINNNDLSYNEPAANLRTDLKSLILWNDNIMIYGIWSSMPNWKQLKQSYEKTWWFYRSKEEIRNLQIDRLVNG